MDKLFGMAFMAAMAEARREVKREENRKRRRRMSAAEDGRKLVCSVCRTYGGTLMNRHGGGYICRECRRKERENETRNDG